MMPTAKPYDRIRVLLGKTRLFKSATAATISSYCRHYSKQSVHPSGTEDGNLDTLPGAQAFCEALSASNSICAIVRDWPTNSIIHTCPWIITALWAPASILLLVKSFADCASDLAESASVSLRILFMAMEQMAEYWGFCRFILCMSNMLGPSWLEYHLDSGDVLTARLSVFLYV
jgi:hypothetical protein